MESNRELMKIKNLSVSYKSSNGTVHAVRNLSLTIKEGETFGLVGETGAGKTTAALSILRILPEISTESLAGQIIFNGEDLLKKSRKEMRKIRGKDIAMIFQDPMTSLDPVNTIGSQIEEMIQLHTHLTKKEIRKAAEQMLATVGIRKERFSDYPYQFSGGMKQRVVIAMALSCNPKLIIADEPTTALDVTIQAQILELMRGLKEKYKTAMIMITHDLGVVADICDTVAIIYAGQIVEYGTVEEIFYSHQHPYTEGLFHSIPDIDVAQSKLKVIEGVLPDPTAFPSGCSFHPRCPYVKAKCSQIEPDNRNVGNNHFVKCFRGTSEEGCD